MASRYHPEPAREAELAHRPILGRTDATGPDVIRGTCSRCGRPIERKPDEFMWRLAPQEGTR